MKLHVLVQMTLAFKAVVWCPQAKGKVWLFFCLDANDHHGGRSEIQCLPRLWSTFSPTFTRLISTHLHLYCMVLFHTGFAQW